MKRIIALVLGLAILAAAPVLGDPGAPPKEEVVYAHLGADGAVNRIFVVNQGTPLAHGKPDEIRSNPAVIKAYLGES